MCISQSSQSDSSELVATRSGTHGCVVSSVLAGPFRVSITFHRSRTLLSRHDHEYASLNVVLDGGVTEAIGLASVALMPGGGTLKPAGAHHGNQFGDTDVLCLLVEHDHSVDAPDDLLMSENGLLWQGAIELLQEIAIGDANGIGAEQTCYALLEQIGRRGESDSPPPSWLSRVVEIVNDQLDQPHSASSLSREVGVHPSHLCRAFRRSVGRSPGQFQREIRIARSLEKLVRTDLSLSSVAAELGFADQSHFVRSFKSVVGETPGRFRLRNSTRWSTRK